MTTSHLEFTVSRLVSSACMRMQDRDRKTGEPIQYDEAAFLDAISNRSPRQLAQALAQLQAEILTLHDIVTNRTDA